MGCPSPPPSTTTAQEIGQVVFGATALVRDFTWLDGLQFEGLGEKLPLNQNPALLYDERLDLSNDTPLANGEEWDLFMGPFFVGHIKVLDISLDVPTGIATVVLRQWHPPQDPRIRTTFILEIYIPPAGSSVLRGATATAVYKQNATAELTWSNTDLNNDLLTGPMDFNLTKTFVGHPVLKTVTMNVTQAMGDSNLGNEEVVELELTIEAHKFNTVAEFNFEPTPPGQVPISGSSTYTTSFSGGPASTIVKASTWEGETGSRETTVTFLSGQSDTLTAQFETNNTITIEGSLHGGKANISGTLNLSSGQHLVTIDKVGDIKPFTVTIEASLPGIGEQTITKTVTLGDGVSRVSLGRFTTTNESITYEYVSPGGHRAIGPLLKNNTGHLVPHATITTSDNVLVELEMDMPTGGGSQATFQSAEFSGTLQTFSKGGGAKGTITKGDETTASFWLDAAGQESDEQ